MLDLELLSRKKGGRGNSNKRTKQKARSIFYSVKIPAYHWSGAHTIRPTVSYLELLLPCGSKVSDMCACVFAIEDAAIVTESRDSAIAISDSSTIRDILLTDPAFSIVAFC